MVTMERVGNAAVYWSYPVEQIKDGEFRFAGFRYISDYPGAQPEGISRVVDWTNPARPKLLGEFVKHKKVRVWVALLGQPNVSVLNC